jgi:WG containing repeat
MALINHAAAIRPSQYPFLLFSTKKTPIPLKAQKKIPTYRNIFIVLQYTHSYTLFSNTYNPALMPTILRPLAFCCCMLWWCAMPCSVVAQEEVEWLVKPEFECALRFFEGMANIQQNGKWGFIDRTGKIVIQP